MLLEHGFSHHMCITNLRIWGPHPIPQWVRTTLGHLEVETTAKSNGRWSQASWIERKWQNEREWQRQQPMMESCHLTAWKLSGFSNEGVRRGRGNTQLGRNTKPDSTKEVGMALNDNHLLRGPGKPSWLEIIHGQASLGLLDDHAPVFLVVQHRWQPPPPYLFLKHSN